MATNIIENFSIFVGFGFSNQVKKNVFFRDKEFFFVNKKEAILN